MLFAAFALCIGFAIIKLRIEGQTIYRKPHAAKLQNSNQNSTLSWAMGWPNRATGTLLLG